MQKPLYEVTAIMDNNGLETAFRRRYFTRDRAIDTADHVAENIPNCIAAEVWHLPLSAQRGNPTFVYRVTPWSLR